jgi:hypothetical protein
VKQESVKHLADGATTLAVGSGASSYFGWFVFVNNNAAGIGVLLSFFFGVVGLIFYWLTWRKSTLADENKTKLDEHIEETKEEFKNVNSGLSEILNKLDE